MSRFEIQSNENTLNHPHVEAWSKVNYLTESFGQSETVHSTEVVNITNIFRS